MGVHQNAAGMSHFCEMNDERVGSDSNIQHPLPYSQLDPAELAPITLELTKEWLQGEEGGGVAWKAGEGGSWPYE